MTKTTIEQRTEVCIFTGNGPIHTAIGNSGTSLPTPAPTPSAPDRTTGKLVVWDGQKTGGAVGALVLPLKGVETALTYYRSGTLATEAIHWPESMDEYKKANALAGNALSHAALPQHVIRPPRRLD